MNQFIDLCTYQSVNSLRAEMFYVLEYMFMYSRALAQGRYLINICLVKEECLQDL